MELLVKKCLSGKFFEMKTATEKGHFGLGYGHKIQSKKSNQIF